MIVICTVTPYLAVASLTGDCNSIYFRGSSCGPLFCFCTFYPVGIVHRQGRLQQAYPRIMCRAIKLSLPGAQGKYGCLPQVLPTRITMKHKWWTEKSIERANKLLWTLYVKAFCTFRPQESLGGQVVRSSSVLLPSVGSVHTTL